MQQCEGSKFVGHCNVILINMVAIICFVDHYFGRYQSGLTQIQYDKFYINVCTTGVIYFSSIIFSSIKTMDRDVFIKYWYIERTHLIK